ncbi:hypothetical protein B7494_g4774 [Chlorociboria aeruginascens]|nr:hypothetical protein B7494_g4774 [Chlorociboria aeruginascens]
MPRLRRSTFLHYPSTSTYRYDMAFPQWTSKRSVPLGVTLLVFVLWLACSGLRGERGFRQLYNGMLEKISRIPPYLLSLGLSKSLTALVWIAGPLCGVVIQPLVGLLSDRTRMSWGRRRPYVVAGTIGTIISMLALAWLEDITRFLTEISNGDEDNPQVTTLTIPFAIICIYILNISIQPLQMGLRALAIENCPTNQQTEAASWASRITGIGNIVGYLAGVTDFSNLFPSLYGKQFQGLCVVGSLFLLITVTITCVSTIEKNPENLLQITTENSDIWTTVRKLGRIYKRMPRKIYRRSLYVSSPLIPRAYSHLQDSLPLLKHLDQLAHAPRGTVRQDGIRLGTLASLFFAIIALLANTTLPFFIRAPNPTPRSKTHPATQHRRFQVPRTTVTRAWTISLLFFALAMFSTVFVTALPGAMVIIALVGLSWAMTLWAPYAIIGTEIMARPDVENSYTAKASASADAGVILSLHNMAISAPQIVAAMLCAAVFGIANALGSRDVVGWALRVGGLAGLGAAALSWELEREWDREWDREWAVELQLLDNDCL